MLTWMCEYIESLGMGDCVPGGVGEGDIGWDLMDECVYPFPLIGCSWVSGIMCHVSIAFPATTAQKPSLAYSINMT